MTFPAKLLNEGEEIILDLRPHWWYLSGPVSVVVVVLAGTIASLAASAPRAVSIALVVVLIVSLGWLLRRYARWATTSFVLTSHRLIHRTGVVAKQGREIPLDHINDISYKQTVFDRIIRAGDLIIESAGERGQEVFPDLPKPGLIQNEIYRQIDHGKARMADRMAGRRELSIPEQIEKLDELRGRGVLTQEEFDAKKAQLLDRM
ncbi:MAG TPA: PH domain-containing protein [Acidimicrobiales bacterium]|nr:PH domain-containing protein [Acidimicrobiales bacterium]